MSASNDLIPARLTPPRLDPDLRAGDRDRDTVAQTLREQHAEGRLDIDELQQRIDVCYEAKTIGELRYLLADLPSAAAAHEHGQWRLGPWPPRLLWLVPAFVALAAISAATGRHLIWFALPLLFAARVGAFRRRPGRAGRLDPGEYRAV